MPATNTDRYPGLRRLVDDRRLIPLEDRLAALGVPIADKPASDGDVLRLRAPIEITGCRTTVK